VTVRNLISARYKNGAPCNDHRQTNPSVHGKRSSPPGHDAGAVDRLVHHATISRMKSKAIGGREGGHKRQRIKPYPRKMDDTSDTTQPIDAPRQSTSHKPLAANKLNQANLNPSRPRIYHPVLFALASHPDCRRLHMEPVRWLPSRAGGRALDCTARNERAALPLLRLVSEGGGILTAA